METLTEKKTYNTTKQILLTAEYPRETRSYKPIYHNQLIDLTLEAIDKAGFQLDTELYTSAKDGKQANGRYSIKNVADNEMCLQIGWQNSYDKSLSLKFAIGTKIFICQNGMVRGDFGNFKKKHVGEIQQFTPQMITDYILQAGEVFTTIQKDRDILKQIEISPKLRAELLGRIYFEEEIIKADQIAIIKKELKVPTHNYGCENSAWELYNHCTFALKESHPTNYFQQHADLHTFFIDKSGLVPQLPDFKDVPSELVF